jgi:peptidoglycan hydrolase-like protein with peptidoglycan-binding domain
LLPAGRPLHHRVVIRAREPADSAPDRPIDRRAPARDPQAARPDGPGSAPATALRIGSPAILDLQRSAGNQAVNRLLRGRPTGGHPVDRTGNPPIPTVQTQAEAPTEAGAPSEATLDESGTGESAGALHPVLRWGKRGPDVLELQTKLNLAGATPELALDSIFGPRTAQAVVEFQLGHGLAPDAIAGPLTWGALDEATIGETGTTGGGGGGGAGGGTPGAPTDTGVGSVDTGEGEPQARAEGSIHPVLRPGFTGSAASELQHKLNGALFLLFPVVPITGTYDPITVGAVTAFKTMNLINEPAVGALDVGPLTWAELDRQAPGSPVGRVEKSWSEVVAGKTYRMVSSYTYRIFGTPPKIQIEVRLGFSGDMTAVPKLLDAIKMTWNRFVAERTDDAAPHEQVAIEFEPLSVSSAPDNSVQLLHSPDPSKPSRSDASHWFVDDTARLSYLAAHEFGHMIGLEDEYQRGHEDFQRVVGAPPPGTALPNAGTAAIQLHHALFLPPDTTEIPIIGPIIDLFRTPEEVRAVEARRVVDNWALVANRRGAFDVATVYDTAFGPGMGRPDLIQAIKQQLPPDRQMEFINIFTFTGGSVMGVPSTMNADVDGNLHEHPVNPRHLRQFVRFVQDFKGGTWVAKQTS